MLVDVRGVFEKNVFKGHLAEILCFFGVASCLGVQPPYKWVGILGRYNTRLMIAKWRWMRLEKSMASHKLGAMWNMISVHFSASFYF